MGSTSDLIQQMASVAGAKSPGKQRIGMQGLQNAVSGQKLFMPEQQLVAYLRSGAAYIESFRPVGYREEQLVQKIIDANWWLSRSSALDNNLLSATLLENSARSHRSNDDPTETIVSQAFGYREECGGANSFEVLNRCSGRVSQLFRDMTEELERAQANRIALHEETFVLAECRVHAWYLDQIRKVEALPAKTSAAQTRVAGPVMSNADFSAAAAEVLQLAEAHNLLGPEDTALLKRLSAT